VLNVACSSETSRLITDYATSIPRARRVVKPEIGDLTAARQRGIL